jgi:cell division septation protein DedD
MKSLWRRHKWALATAGAVLAQLFAALSFAETHHREVRIFWAFITHEVSSLRLALAIFIGMSTVGYAIIRLSKSRWPIWASVRLTWTEMAFPIKASIVGSMTLVSMLALAPYGYARFRIFSETNFQEKALALSHDGRLLDAVSNCEEYFSMFPQRQSGGQAQDPVCVELTSYAEHLRQLEVYLKGQSGEVRIIDQLRVPIDWNAKRFSVAALSILLGRNHALARDYYDAKFFKAEPVQEAPWETFSSPTITPSWVGAGERSSPPTTRPAARLPPSLAVVGSPAPAVKETVFIQLEASSTEKAALGIADRARRSWSDILAGAEIKVVRAEVGPPGVIFRVRAGPFTSRAAARAICEEIKRRQGRCFVPTE